MIFDAQTLMSFNQAITGDDVSDNVIDLGPIAGGQKRDIGKGAPIPIRVQVTEDFNLLTSLTISLEASATENFSSPKTVWSKVVPVADLKAGYVVNLDYIPTQTDERYIRMNYDVTGTDPTAGAVTAGITMGNQTNG